MQLYSTKKAAEYLRLSVAAIKYHIHVAGNLTPDAKIGHSLVFTQATLDRFQENRRSPGRPKKEASKQ